MSYKNTRKKILSFIAAVLISMSLMSFQVGAVDAESEQEPLQTNSTGSISPLWVNVQTSRLILTFVNNKINANVYLNGVSGTKYKNGTVTISKYSGGKYVPIKTWTGLSSASKVFSFSNNELSATSGVTYKMEITITAYTSSKSEVITSSKVAKCP